MCISLPIFVQIILNTQKNKKKKCGSFFSFFNSRRCSLISLVLGLCFCSLSPFAVPSHSRTIAELNKDDQYFSN